MTLPRSLRLPSGGAGSVALSPVLFIEAGPESRPMVRSFAWLRWLAWLVLTFGIGVVAGALLVLRSFAAPAPVVSYRPAPARPTVTAEATSPPPATLWALAAPATLPALQPAEPARRAPARPTARAADAAAPGRLFINAIPWGVVWIDGRAIDTTPLLDLPISPGIHRLRIDRNGFEAYERVLRIEPGQTLRLTGIVLSEAEP